MDLPQPQAETYSAELLTRWFRISGRFKPLGELISFLNDPRRNVLIIDEAQVTPLQPDYRIGGFNKAEVVVPRQDVQLALIVDLQADEMRLLPRTEHLVVYSNTYAISGHFHTGEETKVNDIFHVSSGPFFPASDVKVYSISTLNVPVETATSVAFFNKEHLGLFHSMS